MFLSSIKIKKEVQTLHIDFVTNSLSAQGFEVLKPKNKDLESGLNISSFTLQKNGIHMSTFVFQISKNQFICAGYHQGKLVKEKQCKYESDLPSVLIDLFNNIKKSSSDQPIRFDIQLEVMQKVCERIEQKQKNVNNFTQEVKTSEEYQSLKEIERTAYERIALDAENLIRNKQKIKKENEYIIEPLLKIESCKQSLQTAIMAFEQQSSYMTNARERIKQNLQTLRSASVELNPSKLTDQSLNDYLNHSTKIKEMELKQKYLVS